MDRAIVKQQAAGNEQGADWYSFHQGRSDERGRKQPQERPGSDPYEYHQGPRRHRDRRGPEPSYPDQRDKQRQRLTLYDVAEGTLKKEGRKSYSQDDIYFRLNDMMVAHGYKKANIDGRTRINDHMLPRSWNYVDPRKLLEAPRPKEPGEPRPGEPKQPDDKAGDPGKDKPQSPEEKAREDYQKQVEAALAEKFTLPPIERGKGYYDSVAKAHPDWKPKQVLEEARRVRELNDNRLDLKVGERVWTISKDEKAALIKQAMDEYDRARQSKAP